MDVSCSLETVQRLLIYLALDQHVDSQVSDVVDSSVERRIRPLAMLMLVDFLVLVRPARCPTQQIFFPYEPY